MQLNTLAVQLFLHNEFVVRSTDKLGNHLVRRRGRSIAKLRKEAAEQFNVGCLFWSATCLVCDLRSFLGECRACTTSSRPA